MVQGYYTLEEASRILGMDAEELSQMAQKREVRAFADRGTWRFRTQDIEELGRRRGLGSNPDLQLGEAPRPRPHDSPAPRHPSQPTQDLGVFNFPLGPGEGDQVEIGQEIVVESSGSAKRGSPGSSKRTGPKSPPPKPGSDSDVRLVAEGSDIGFQLAGEPKAVDSPVPAPRSGGKKTSLASDAGEDSGVRLVGTDSDHDSDVKIVPDSSDDFSFRPPASTSRPGSDSDIRIEPPGGPKSGVRIGKQSPEDSVLTDEIDLDAEVRKAEEAARSKKKDKTRPRAKQTQLPTTSPFELSDSDLEAPKAPPAPAKSPDSSSDFDLATRKPESSSDFDLAAGGKDDSSPIAMASDDESPTLGLHEEDAVELGGAPGKKAGHDSGISLQDPADSGISLEQEGSSDEIEFELSLDSAESTPKPVRSTPEVDSDSEFELTLDDSGGLAPLEEETAAEVEEEKDIFETDFEVPALEDESGSQAVALEESDTDLESSDFDLALGEEDAGADEESGSQVVVLEDEEGVDEGAATIARPTRKGGKAVRALEDELDEELEVAEDEEAPVRGRRVAAAPAAPAAWGAMPAVVMLFSVIIMFVTSLTGFELLNGMWGYRQGNKVSGPFVRFLSESFGVELPKE